MSGTGTNISALAAGVQKWGLAHWSYILVAIAANVIGVILHI